MVHQQKLLLMSFFIERHAQLRQLRGSRLISCAATDSRQSLTQAKHVARFLRVSFFESFEMDVQDTRMSLFNSASVDQELSCLKVSMLLGQGLVLELLMVLLLVRTSMYSHGC